MKYLLIIIITYLYIYNPVFSALPSIDSLMVMYPLLFLLVFGKYQYALIKCRKILLTWSVVFFFILIRTIAGGEFSYIYGWVGYLIEAILISIIWAVFLSKNGVDIIKLLLLVSSISATISCLCLFFPTIDSFVRSIQIEYTEVNKYIIIRSFGLAQGLNFEFSIVQGLVFGIGLFNIKDNKWFAFFMPLIVISILINARTGFLVVILALLIYMLYKKIIVIPLVAFITVSFAYVSLRNYIPEETGAWIEEFFFQIEDAIFGTNKAQFNTAGELGDMLIWPNDLPSWILGNGHSLFRLKSGANSDVGYVNQIAYGGGIYFCLVVYLFYISVNKCYKYIPRFLFYFIIITSLLINIKGSVFGVNSSIIRVLSLFSFTTFFACQIKNSTYVKR